MVTSQQKMPAALQAERSCASCDLSRRRKAWRRNWRWNGNLYRAWTSIIAPDTTLSGRRSARSMAFVATVLDWIGRRIAERHQAPANGYEPFSPADPETLRRTLRPADVLTRYCPASSVCPSSNASRANTAATKSSTYVIPACSLHATSICRPTFRSSSRRSA